MNFEQQKKQFLRKPDKSWVGGIDKAILSLCNKLNKSKDYFTTSSCAGRIVLVPETGQKQEKIFAAIFHEKPDYKKISRYLPKKPVMVLIYIKHEPCILHVACRTLKSAEQLVNKARHAGWKKSGIISIKQDKVMCELVSTEILSAPIMNKGEMIVSEKYLKLLVNECSSKLMRTRTKIKKLEKVI